MSTEGGGATRWRTFGQALHELRLRRSLSIDELAHSVGIPRTAVAQLEGGEELPGPMTLDLLIRELQPRAEEADLFRSLATARSVASADAPGSAEVDGPDAPAVPRPKRVAFDAAIAAAAIALLWGTFDFAHGVPAVVLCVVGLICLGCVAVTNHATGRLQRSAIVAFLCSIPFAIGALYWATNSQQPSGTPAPSSARSTVTAQSTPASTTPSTNRPATHSAIEKPTSYELEFGSSVTLYGGGLVVGVPDGYPTYVTLVLSTPGPECQTLARLAEKVIFADPARNRWYEIRLTKIDYPKVLLTVARGTGVVDNQNCA